MSEEKDKERYLAIAEAEFFHGCLDWYDEEKQEQLIKDCSRSNCHLPMSKSERKERNRYEGLRLYQKYAYEYILKNFDKTGSILEVGIGRGHLFKKLYEAGFDIDGIEYQEVVWRKYKENGFQNVFFADICNFTSEKKYELIICQEVLEHVDSPVRALENIYECLKPEGIVILSTPNANHLNRLVFRKRTDYQITMNHINCFDEFQFRLLFEWCKFKTLKIKYLYPTKFFPRLKGLCHILKPFFYLLFLLPFFRIFSYKILAVAQKGAEV